MFPAAANNQSYGYVTVIKLKIPFLLMLHSSHHLFFLTNMVNNACINNAHIQLYEWRINSSKSGLHIKLSKNH